ncbi:MAG: hypothetical protein SNJ84_00550, partial [Verrucomicrobiia bacterium]
RPQGHWINAITALIAAVDPITCEENELVRYLHYLVGQGQRPGKFLPMPGMLPEKYDVPDGAYYDDIRPQAFAQSSFLAACTSLGVRRLPFGLAVRPTQFLSQLTAYAWRHSSLDFHFKASHDGVHINGVPLPHSLQLPEDRLPPGSITVSVGNLPQTGTLARSNVVLHSVRSSDHETIYEIDAPGLSELAFTQRPQSFHLKPPILPEAVWTNESGLAFVRFNAVGPRTIHCTFA